MRAKLTRKSLTPFAQSGSDLGVRRRSLGGQAEVGKRTLAVKIGDEPCHLLPADMEKVCSPRPHLSKVQSACLAAAAVVDEHEHALVVELTYSCGSARYSAQALSQLRKPSAMPANPAQLPGAGPSATTYSISGCAHSAEL